MAFERLDDPFVLRHAHFKSWRCVKFGFDCGWIGAVSLATVADQFIDQTRDTQELLLASELAALRNSHSEKAKELLDELCAIETTRPNGDIECWKLWLSLGLLWLCDHQRFIKDPLEIAESFVDDLSVVLKYRPREATTWLRYMPVDTKQWNPAFHSEKQNYERLMMQWKVFLKQYAEVHLKKYGDILSACS